MRESIKAARLAAKMTQQTVADHLGIDRSSYARYETGTREPDMDTLHRLASLFNVSSDYLLGLTDHPNPIQGDDAEIWELREHLRRKPGMRTLLSATKDVNEEDLQKIIRIVEALNLQGDSNAD